MTDQPIITIVERLHNDRGVKFVIGSALRRYYVPVCCAKATVEIIDEETRNCVTSCKMHGQVMRIYEPERTPEDRQAQAELAAAFNPPSDPDGRKTERKRKGAYSTSKWYQARGLR